MADISKLKVDNVDYNVKDASAPARPLGSGYSKTGTLPISSTDTISEAIGKLENTAEANQTNILSVEDMICDNEFSTSTAYSVGDIVTYEHGLYKFNTAHSAGAWNSSQVDEVSAVDLISSGDGTDSVVSKEIYVTKPINQPDTWESKSWSGLTSFDGCYVWSDGTNIYYSYSSTQYVLNKATSTWKPKTWNGLTDFHGIYTWTDGTDIFYSYGTSNQYVLDKATSTWKPKTWNGLTDFDGQYVWTDGDNIYYSADSDQYVLNKSTSTWETKAWTGLSSFYSAFIWTDGINIFYSFGSTQKVLDKATSTWSTKAWTGLSSFYSVLIWTDGDNIYYSEDSDQYVLDKSTSTWNPKTWNDGYIPYQGIYIWTDGDNVYYSDDSDGRYVLKRPLKTTKIPDVKNNAQLTALIGDINSVLEAVL